MDNEYIDVAPGIVTELSGYSLPGRYIDGNNVRFEDGKARKVAGWSSFIGSSADGACRAIVSWNALDSTGYLAVASDKRVYITDAQTLNNVTPLRTTNTIASGNLSVDSGDNTVTVTDVAHGALNGDYAIFDSAVTFGGITIDAGQEVSVTFFDADTWTFEHTETPTSTATSAGAVDVDYELNTSQEPGSDIGWGEGGWGGGAVGWGGTAGSYESAYGITRIWTLVSFGEDLYGCFRGSTLYKWDKTNGLTTRMAAVSGAPASIMSLLVTADRHLVALGATDSSGNDDGLNVRWPDRETDSTWTAAAGNTAGEDRIESGGEIVGSIKVGNFGNLILTNTGAHTLRPIGQPYVMSLKPVQEGCGMIAPNAGESLNSVAHWMGFNSFFRYNGVVSQVHADVHDTVFQNIDRNLRGNIFCSTNNEYSEILWFYTSNSSVDGENDRVVGINLMENGGRGAWWIGDIQRSCWIDTNYASPRYPIAVGNDGLLFYHEVDSNPDNSPTNYHLTTSDIEIPGGGNFIRTHKIIPDFSEIEGTHYVTLILKNYPQGAERTKGPFTVTSATEKISTRARGRTMRIKLHSDSADAKMFMGRWRFSPRISGKKS